jgi:hypothetical protein
MMVLSESFQVAAVIKKLSAIWKDFNNYFRYKKKKDENWRSYFEIRDVKG